MKVATIVGARPQFIKAAMVSRAFGRISSISEVFIHTGQHYDDNMSQVFFRELQLPEPRYNLGIGSGSHGEQTGRMLAALDNVLDNERPDWTVVYGDTNSTLAGALAAAKLHIRIAHVEAGLRSLNRLMPEEINRVVTDHVADLLFAPTTTAMAHLRREGIDETRICLTGDVMYDAAIHFAERAEQESSILRDLGLTPKEYILATVHRAENTDSAARLRTIIQSLLHVSASTPVVFPVHPRTRKAIERLALWEEVSKMLLVIPPVGFLDMALLEKHSRLVATDSGGVQKEAYFYSVPCITMRDETEWVELVESGWNRVVPPTDCTMLINALSHSSAPADYPSLYGNGNASEAIVARLHSGA